LPAASAPPSGDGGEALKQPYMLLNTFVGQCPQVALDAAERATRSAGRAPDASRQAGAQGTPSRSVFGVYKTPKARHGIGELSVMSGQVGDETPVL